VFRTALTKFDGLPTPYMGLDIPCFLAAMKAAVEPILNLPEAAFDPARERGQNLPFDPKAAPTITLIHDPFIP
jgi:hypothetical protein